MNASCTLSCRFMGSLNELPRALDGTARWDKGQWTVLVLKILIYSREERGTPQPAPDETECSTRRHVARRSETRVDSQPPQKHTAHPCRGVST